MRVVSVSQMRELDRRAMEDCGIPSLLLMENAGRGVAELITRSWKGGRVTVFAGKGHNGGDGLVAARHLYNRGFEVQIFLFTDPVSLKGDPALHYKIVSRMRIPLRVFQEGTKASAIAVLLERTDIVVDALLGVGLKAPLLGVYAEAVAAINQMAKPVVAIDIPSGLDGDSGEVRGIAVKAAITATLGFAKQGLFQGRGPDYAGRIRVVDISLPKEGGI